MDSLTGVVFDIMSTVAFAVSGAMVAIDKRMDVFGVIVLAALTAVGGGMVRDVLAGITPPMALCDITDFMRLFGHPCGQEMPISPVTKPVPLA